MFEETPLIFKGENEKFDKSQPSHMFNVYKKRGVASEEKMYQFCKAQLSQYSGMGSSPTNT